MSALKDPDIPRKYIPTILRVFSFRGSPTAIAIDERSSDGRER